MNKKVIIVGSGAGGVFAAQGLVEQGIRPTLIDVGHEPNSEILSPADSLHKISDQNILSQLLLGNNNEGLKAFLYNAPYLSPRLKAPGFQYVTEGTTGNNKSNNTVSIVKSFAKGGLTNAWGAGAYRFTEYELRSTPLSYDEMSIHYNRVTELIGVSGTNNDNLCDEWGYDPFLQDPIRLSRNAKYFLNNYKKQNSNFDFKIKVGMNRLAVLTKELNGRNPIEYKNTEFLDAQDRSFYSARYTLENLIKENKIDYVNHFKANTLKSNNQGLEVLGQNILTGAYERLSGNKIILAAGCLESSKILLNSFSRELPPTLNLLDNYSFQIPVLFPTLLGYGTQEATFGSGEISVIFNKPRYKYKMHGALFNLNSISRVEFYDKIPAPFNFNKTLMKTLLPAMGAIFLFVENNGEYCAQLSISENQLIIKPNGFKYQIEKNKIASDLRKLGAYTLPFLMQDTPFGGSIHYAGSTPMRENPTEPFHTDKVGRLHMDHRILVADGSWLPSMPAKNPTYTIMANAHRVGTILGKELRENNGK